MLGSSNRTRLLLFAAAVSIAAAVWLTGRFERGTAQRSYDASRAGQLMLTSMLNQETGFRGYELTHREAFLEPYSTGHAAYITAVASARAQARGGTALSGTLAEQESTAERWHASAEASISRTRRLPRSRLPILTAPTRKGLMDRFRAANARFERLLADRRGAELGRAGWISAGVVVAVSALFAALGYLLISRGARAERRRREDETRYRDSQHEFTRILQVTQSEGEAHDLLRRHVERSLPGTSLVVLNRDNSADRLEATTPLERHPGLAERLAGAQPRSCLAVRLGATHERIPDEQRLLDCAICGAAPNATTCAPLLVSGEVIGSVLVEHIGNRVEDGSQRIAESVAQAAPTLANLRNLALAERRAMTDVLTGLSNRRAVADSLKRMLAHAGRSLTPLGVVVVDLDCFKSVNDDHGHDAGDQVLAAVGEALGTTVRTSDLAGRNGGEEFIVLMPDTDRGGAAVAAEKIRAAIARLPFPHLGRHLTASVGVAAYPQDAGDGEKLLREADRALYGAKQRGRNRVEVAGGQAPAVEVD